MPDLIHSLQTRDLGHLRIVAGLWGVDLLSTDAEEALDELSAALLDVQRLSEIVDSLPAGARSALDALTVADGKLPWAAFARSFGEIREAGPGRRDREQIYLNPVSAAETLFYRALLARAFFDTPAGPQEFAYIPDDLLKKLGCQVHKEDQGETQKSTLPIPLQEVDSEPLGRPASPKEREHPLPANDRILDDTCTMLAALRLGWDSLPRSVNFSLPEHVLRDFLRVAKLVANSAPQPESVKEFLAAPRGDALSLLLNAWLGADTFNELRQLPGLACEGEWTNQPLVTREFLLDLLSALPPGKWWSLNGFVRAVKEKYADFQRPAGDYDSWFIKRTSDGSYLRGFASWDEVDGALVRYLITGPMFWLGMVDLARPEEGETASAFRVRGDEARMSTPETGRLHVTSQGRVDVPRLLPRAARYQIARFCDWEDGKEDEYRYRVTTASLKRAKAQGLKVSQLLGLLKNHAAAPVPPPFVRALQRWELKGTEARLETLTVLRVGSPDVLEELRKSKAGRFLGDTLGPVTVVVKAGAHSKVLAALAELGLLADAVLEASDNENALG